MICDSDMTRESKVDMLARAGDDIVTVPAKVALTAEMFMLRKTTEKIWSDAAPSPVGNVSPEQRMAEMRHDLGASLSSLSAAFSSLVPGHPRDRSKTGICKH